MTTPGSTPLLEVRNLRKYFPIQKGFFKKTIGNVRAVDDVSFFVEEGETLGLVGESGCGKTTTSRYVVRALAPSSGQMLFRTGEGQVVDLARLDRAALRPLRPRPHRHRPHRRAGRRRRLGADLPHLRRRARGRAHR